MRSTIACATVVMCLVVAAHGDDKPVAIIDLARAKSLALETCAKKYQATDANTLKYTGLTISASPDDSIAINVAYLVDGSGERENVERNGFQMSRTRQTTYTVEMDVDGRITKVSSGSSVSVQSVGRGSQAGQAPHGFRTGRQDASPGAP